MQSELLLTSDGSHTLYVSGLDECYHSTHGAIQESQHIFIEAGLKQCTKNDIAVLEIGFGTGLNAFLTLLEAEKSHKRIHFSTLELYPVEIEKAIQLNYPNLIAIEKKELFNLLHTSEWNKEIEITENFILTKIRTDFTSYTLTGKFDVVFFDAFSAEKQPEMWEQEQFTKLYQHCTQNAVLTTYCAKGMVRRAMQSAGFTVERLQGPPGKREILRGKRI